MTYDAELQKINEKSKLHGKLLSFNDLPVNVRQRIVSMETGKVDYFRLVFGGTELNMAFVIFCAVAAFILSIVSFFILRSFGQHIVLWLSFVVVFLMWTLYSIWGYYRKKNLRVTDAWYITPTQVITVENGIVSYFELKDIQNDIGYVKVITKSGKPRRTTVKYEITLQTINGHNFSFSLPTESVISNWCQKFNNWRIYARTAFEQKNFAYLDSWDVFQGVDPKTAKTRYSGMGTLRFIFMLLISLIIPTIGFSISENLRLDNSFNNASAEDTVTQYQVFAGSSNKAAKRINELYELETAKINDKQVNAVDKPAIEALLKMLDIAKNSNDNVVSLKISSSALSPTMTKEQLGGKIAEKFKLNFPDEVIRAVPDYNSFYLKPRFEIEIRDSKPLNPKMKPVTGSPNKFDFTCVTYLENKQIHTFELKAATFDEFLSEFRKRFGFEK